VTVVGVKSPGEEFTYAEPATRISDHDVIIVAGVPEDVERFSSLQS
jgi:trk system potassium uptake protein TrkA